jgi:hypothetical protein
MDTVNVIHPAPVEFSESEITRMPILRFFHYAHLPPRLQAISKPFCELASAVFRSKPIPGQETAACLRKLLEAKDCAVRDAV